jgi:class 3 adenylate cyclase
VIDDGRIDQPTATYRGFLFSDMRGFTAFGERYGNAAAAEMVARFLDIARRAIARHAGAEIKTEGDAIHAVFPSASGAVLCGLAMVDAAAELNAKQPDRPLSIGVGIHAGEAVETAEGYIGRAVNIAARVCAIARPGEVLVTSTVKGITQASITVGFIPRGQRRLKGIKDPILLYAVSRDPDVRATRSLPRPVALGAAATAAIGVIVVLVLAGAQLLRVGTGNAPPGPTAVPQTPRPLTIGSLAFGTYRSVVFQPAMSFEIVDSGWAATRDTAGLLSLVRESDPPGSLSALRVSQVVANPCTEGDPGAATGPNGPDVLAELAALPHAKIANRVSTQVGGLAGEQADVTIDPGAQAACGGLVGNGVAVFMAGGEAWRAQPGELFRLIAVGSGTRAVTLVVSSDWTRTPSVQQVQSILELGNRLLARTTF